MITAAHFVGGKWIIERMTDAHDEVTVHRADATREKVLPLPNFGSAGGFDGRQTDVETFYSVTGFDTPGTIYRYDTRTGLSTVHQETDLAFDQNSWAPKT